MSPHTNSAPRPTQSRPPAQRPQQTKQRTPANSSAVGNANNSRKRFANWFWTISGRATKSAGQCSPRPRPNRLRDPALVPCQPGFAPCALRVEALSRGSWRGPVGIAAVAPLRGTPGVSLAHPPTRCVDLSAAVRKAKNRNAMLVPRQESHPRRLDRSRRPSGLAPAAKRRNRSARTAPEPRTRSNGVSGCLGSGERYPVRDHRDFAFAWEAAWGIVTRSASSSGAALGHFYTRAAGSWPLAAHVKAR
jgi:hypothetical protein